MQIVEALLSNYLFLSLEALLVVLGLWVARRRSSPLPLLPYWLFLGAVMIFLLFGGLLVLQLQGEGIQFPGEGEAAQANEIVFRLVLTSGILMVAFAGHFALTSIASRELFSLRYWIAQSNHLVASMLSLTYTEGIPPVESTSLLMKIGIPSTLGLYVLGSEILFLSYLAWLTLSTLHRSQNLFEQFKIVSLVRCAAYSFIIAAVVVGSIPTASAGTIAVTSAGLWSISFAIGTARLVVNSPALYFHHALSSVLSLPSYQSDKSLEGVHDFLSSLHEALRNDKNWLQEERTSSPRIALSDSFSIHFFTTSEDPPRLERQWEDESIVEIQKVPDSFAENEFLPGGIAVVRLPSSSRVNTLPAQSSSKDSLLFLSHLQEKIAQSVDFAQECCGVNLVCASPELLSIFERAKLYADTLLPIFIQGGPGVGKRSLLQAIHTRRKGGAQYNLQVDQIKQGKGLPEDLYSLIRKNPAVNPGIFLFGLEQASPSQLAVCDALISELPETVFLYFSYNETSENSDEGAVRRFLIERQPLFIHLPPLRERPLDITSQAFFFLHHYNELYGKRIEAIETETVRKLETFNWPFNSLSLKDSVALAVLRATSRVITQIPFWEDFMKNRTVGVFSIEDAQVKRTLRQTLELCDGNISKGSEQLGISLQLMNALRQYYEM